MQKMSVFSDNLKSALKKSGLTQKQLADRLNITEVTISRYVNGTRVPRGTLLSGIANVLNVSVDSLLNGEEQEEETLRLSKSECMRIVLTDYGIDLSRITQKMLEHIVGDFLEMLVKQGYAERKME